MHHDLSTTLHAATRGHALVKVLSHDDFQVPTSDRDMPNIAATAIALESAFRIDGVSALKEMLEQNAVWPASAMQRLLVSTESPLDTVLILTTEAFDTPVEAEGGQSLAEVFVAEWRRILTTEDRTGANATWIIARIDELSLTAARKSVISSAPILAAADTVTLGIGAGSAELNLGILLGLLEVRVSVENLTLLSLATGEFVDARVKPQPIRRLLRQRQFADARPLSERGIRKTLAVLDAWQSERGASWSIDDTPLNLITRELAFFDQLAAGSAQGTVQGRRWLAERFIDLGGRVPPGLAIGKVRGDPDHWYQSSPEAQQFFEDYKFLIPRAATQNHHRDEPLLRRDLHALRAEEARVRESDPRLGTDSGTQAMPFWATPSGSVLVGLCLGLNPDVDSLLGAIAANRTRLVEIATGLSEEDQVQLACRSTPTMPRVTVLIMGSMQSSSADTARATAAKLKLDLLLVETEEPTSVTATRQVLTDMCSHDLAGLMSGEDAIDGAIFLIGTGRQEMQVGTLLGLLELTESAGTHLHVGSIQRRGDEGRTEIRLDHAAVALFPDAYTRHIAAALAHIDECEYAAAAAELGSLTPSQHEEPSDFMSRIASIRSDLSKLADDLKEKLNGRTRQERALAVAERLMVFKYALDQGELPAQATVSRLYVPLESAFAGSGPGSGWDDDWIRGLRELRNYSTWNHGEKRCSVKDVAMAINYALREELKMAGKPGDVRAAEGLYQRALGVRRELAEMTGTEDSNVI